IKHKTRPNNINPKPLISFSFMEVPTYPYENEIKGFRLKFLERVFSLMLPFFKRRIDTVTYFGQPTEKIWGIEAVRLSNGVDVSSIKLAEEKVSSGDNELFTVVGVANLSFWHGYDRLILGVKNYCGKRTVIFKIVGDLEPELTRLTSIVKKENLSDKIFFLGRLSGDELDNVFASADVCVDALGRHRSGNDYNSSIKSKEYCARGLPFIKSHIDSAFDDNAFIYQVPSDDTPVNIEDIINWRKSLNPGFSIEERRYAELELTWEKQFQILFSSFE
ncbi:glycosyltransferase, partial [Serratia fonticola]|nr:glycosyltransferase [Serratia fonticola]